MKTFVAIIAVLVSPIVLFGQCAGGSFSNAYDGSADEKGHSFCRNAGGGFTIASVSQTTDSNSDWMLTRLNESSEPLWTKVYDGNNNETGENLLVIERNQGGFIMAGYSGTASRDLLISRLSETGDVEWAKTVNAVISPGETPNDIQQVSDTEFILVGSTNSFSSGSADGLMVKFNDSGSILWSRGYGTGQNQHIYSIQPLPDGNYLCTGRASTGGSSTQYAWLFVMDSDGEVIEDYIYTASGSCYFMDAVVMPDGSLVCVGAMDQSGQSTEFFWCMLDSEYNVTSSGIDGSMLSDRFSSVQLTESGELILSGYTQGFGASVEALAICVLEDSGDLVGASLLSFSGNDSQSLYGQNALAFDSNIYLTGWTDAFGDGLDMAFHKLDECAENGCTEELSLAFTDVSMQRVNGNNSATTFSGFMNYSLTAETTNPEEKTLCTEILTVHESEGQPGLSFWIDRDRLRLEVPSEWSGGAIAVRLLDASGRLVLSEGVPANTSIADLDVSHLAHGLYIVQAIPTSPSQVARSGAFWK